MVGCAVLSLLHTALFHSLAALRLPSRLLPRRSSLVGAESARWHSPATLHSCQKLQQRREALGRPAENASLAMYPTAGYNGPGAGYDDGEQYEVAYDGMQGAAW